MIDTMPADIDSFRRFVRLFTARAGVLRKRLYGTRLSLAETRVLFELANRTAPRAQSLCADLGIDPGYMSRILAGFGRAGWLRSAAAQGDRRARALALTQKGRAAFAAIEQTARAEIGALLEPLAANARGRLVGALATAEKILSPPPDLSREPFVLRAPRAGDLGWIVHRHGAIYAREYGFDDSFEGEVAAILAKFAARRDAAHERCWIAERDGEIVGAILCARESPDEARLRVFYLEASARGQGLAKRMVAECVDFARRMGYRRLVLSTYANLGAARKLYVAAGFAKTGRTRVRHFGKTLVAESWALELI
jgi:DNA-binding MarR family transcriptional regulator/GNAT superfamily N-acetyltransferase